MCLFLSGWQTRWFILDNGVLAYYKSQEEVNQGCKGTMKVTACEIIGNYNCKCLYVICVIAILTWNLVMKRLQFESCSVDRVLDTRDRLH